MQQKLQPSNFKLLFRLNFHHGAMMINLSRLSLAVVGVSALVVPGCTQMKQFYPDMQVLMIDGEEIAVGPVSGMPGVYRAMPNRPTPNQGFRSDPSSLPKNIKAIEAASGCAVIRDSVQVRSVATLAAVDCGSSVQESG